MSDVNIDTLKIQVGADSQDAKSSIDALASSLKSLKDSAKMTTVVNNLQRLSEGLKALNETCKDLDRISQIADAIRPLSEIKNNVGFKTMANGLNNLISVVNSIDDSTFTNFVNQMNLLAVAIAPLRSEMTALATSFKDIKDVSKSTASNINHVSTSLKNYNNVGKSSVNIGNQFHRMLTKTAIKAQILGKMFVSLFTGIGSLGDLFSTSLNNASSFYEILNLLDVSMGKFKDDAIEFANLTNKALGINRSELLNSMATFSSIATGFGMTSDKAYQLAKNLTEVAYDLSSLKNIQVEEAMNKVRSGLTGELEPLRNLGFALDTATLQQVAYNHNIDLSVQKMTQQQKAVLRSVAIFEQSRKMGAEVTETVDGETRVIGDLQKTLNTVSNQLRILKAQVQEMARALGEALMPILQKVLPYANALVVLLTRLANKLSAFLGFKGYESEAEGFGKITEEVQGTDEAVQKLKNHLAGFDELNVIGSQSSSDDNGGNGYAGDLGIDFGEIWNEEALKELSKETNSILGRMEEQLENIKKKVKEITNVSEDEGNVLTGIKGALAGIGIGALVLALLRFKDVANYTKTFFSLWKGTSFGEKLTLIKMMLGDIVKEVVGMFNPITVAFTVIVALFSTAYARSKELRDSVAELGGHILETFSGAWEKVKTIIEPTLNMFIALKDTIVNMWNMTADALTPAFITLTNILDFLWQNVVSPLINLFVDLGVALWNGVADTITNHVLPTLTSFWQCISNIIETVSNLVSYLWDTLEPTFTNVFNGIKLSVELVGEIFSFIFEDVFNILNSVLDFLTNVFTGNWSGAWESAKEVVSGVGTYINDILWGVVGGMFSIGANIVQGLIDGIGSLTNSLKKTVTDVGTGISNWFKEKLGIHSPSKVMEENGEYTVAGIVKGIDAESDNINNSVIKLTNTMKQSVNQAFASFNKEFMASFKKFNSENIKSMQNVCNLLVKEVDTLFDDAYKLVKNGWSNIQGTWSNYVHNLMNMTDSGMNYILNVVNNTVKRIEKSVSNAQSSITKLESLASKTESLANGISSTTNKAVYSSNDAIRTYANGGMVTSGQLFVARESGAELVGNIGNRTGVMNNQQIVDAVAQGVASAVASVMGGNSQDVTISLDGKVLAKAMVNNINRMTKQNGYSPLVY